MGLRNMMTEGSNQTLSMALQHSRAGVGSQLALDTPYVVCSLNTGSVQSQLALDTRSLAVPRRRRCPIAGLAMAPECRISAGLMCAVSNLMWDQTLPEGFLDMAPECRIAAGLVGAVLNLISDQIFPNGFLDVHVASPKILGQAKTSISYTTPEKRL